MYFIITSQGCSGTGSLARALNSVEDIYSSHGHFPFNKDYKVDFYDGDTSPTYGNMLKNIFTNSFEEIFLYLEDLFPDKKHYGLTHSFTISSLMNKNREIINSDKYTICNVIRDPFNTYLSSKALVKKSIEKTNFGKKMYLDQYSYILKKYPKLREFSNKIAFENINSTRNLEAIISAHSVYLMFNEIDLYTNKIKTLRIEDILKSKDDFLFFLQNSLKINIDSQAIPSTFKKVNSHANKKTKEKDITEVEYQLLHSFLGHKVRSNLLYFYPESKLTNIPPRFYSSPVIRNNKIQNISRNQILRTLRESLVLNTSRDFSNFGNSSFRELELNKTLERIDELLLEEDMRFYDHLKKFIILFEKIFRRILNLFRKK